MTSTEELDKLQERWIEIIRHNDKKLRSAINGEKVEVCQPDLHCVANEIKAFFTALKITI